MEGTDGRMDVGEKAVKTSKAWWEVGGGGVDGADGGDGDSL